LTYIKIIAAIRAHKIRNGFLYFLLKVEINIVTEHVNEQRMAIMGALLH